MNDRCILKTWLCDGIMDCKHGEDEKVPECGSWWFMVVCGGSWWFVVVYSGLWGFMVVCGG